MKKLTYTFPFIISAIDISAMINHRVLESDYYKFGGKELERENAINPMNFCIRLCIE